MNRLHLCVLALFLLFIQTISYSQAPGSKWTRYLPPVHNQNYEFGFDSRTTPDKGYVIAGVDTGFNFVRSDLVKKWADGRAWIAKLDSNGTFQWSRNNHSNSFIDPHSSGYTSVCIGASGSYVAAGYGVRFSAGPNSDVLIAAYSPSGAYLWDSTFGGTNIDRAYDVQPTPDGGYIIAGFTKSNDGWVTGNHSPGFADAWLVKVGSSGQFQWQKCYGGSGADTAFAIEVTPDGGYIVAGNSASSNGDLTGNSGMTDGWVFKTDNSGNIIWQKNIGSLRHEALKGIVLNSDNTITLTGYTASLAGLTSNPPIGLNDLWVLKLNTDNGNTVWSKRYGGSQDEQGYSIQKTIGNGYLVAGYTASADGDVTGTLGTMDSWLLNLDEHGNKIWQKTSGTGRSDIAFSVHVLSETDFAMTGFGKPTGAASDSADGYITRLGKGAYIKGTFTVPVSSGLVKAVKPGIEYSTIPVNGVYGLNVDSGTYTVSYLPAPYTTTTPAPVVTSFLNFFDTATVNFNVTATPPVRDLSISLVPLGVARPGFSLIYKIFYSNHGSQVENGQVVLKLDSGLTFNHSSPSSVTVVNDTLKWDYENLVPGTESNILVYMNVKAPPVVNNGDTLTSVAFITPVDGDVTPSDDTATLQQRVQGSYDPNDKTEASGGRISPDHVLGGKYLNYLIRFQNTGTDTAFNIQVRDTLDTKLDWNSIQIVAASHPYTIQINAQKAITWHFNNILLPDSNVNEPASHGYILYRVKTRSDVLIEDTIKNSASIYFDYNLPVKTNTETTVVKPDSAICPGANGAFRTMISGDSYQWQVNTGSGFTDITNDAVYTGAQTSMIRLITPPTSMTRNVYRCVITTGGMPQYSPEFVLKFETVWNGNTSPAWDNPLNWNCGALPDENTDVVILGGRLNSPSVNVSTSCRSLYLQPTAAISIANGVILDIKGR